MTDSSNTAPRRLDTSEAVDSILIRPEDNKVAPESVEEIVEESTEKAVAVQSDEAGGHLEEEAEGAEEAPAETKEATAEAEESEEEADTETVAEEDQEPAAEEEEEEQEVLYTLQDGEEVTLDELKRGHLRQADYTQKTQSLAEERQAFETEQQSFGEQRNTTAEALMMAMNIVEPKLVAGAQTDWQALANEDAYAYQEQWAGYQQAQLQWNQLQEAGVRETQAQAQQNAVAQQAYNVEQSQALQLAIPDLADPTKAKALQASLREYAVSSGLTEQEAAGISDHRVVVMLNKARLYDEMQSAGKTVVNKKLSKSPKKVVKPGQPVSKAEQTANAKKAKRVALANSGSIEDAAEWLLTGN